MHTGVFGEYIEITGKPRETNVNVVNYRLTPYTATVKPIPNYAWSDGTTVEKTVKWYIYPITDAKYDRSDLGFTGRSQSGVFNREYTEFVKPTTESAINIGTYTSKVRPSDNHAWASSDPGSSDLNKKYDVSLQIPKWRIISDPQVVPEIDVDDFVYNGKYQGPDLTAYTDPGTDFNKNGSDRTGEQANFTVSGTTRAIDAGNYEFTLKLKNGKVWEDGTTAPKTFYWKIKPYPVTFNYDKNANTWTYDGSSHSGHLEINFLYYNDALGRKDKCNITYKNNIRTHYDNENGTNGGVQEFRAVGLDNPNYCLPYDYKTKKDLNQNYKMYIKQKPSTVTWTAYKWTYDTTQREATAVLDNVLSADKSSYYIYIDNRYITNANQSDNDETEVKKDVATINRETGIRDTRRTPHNDYCFASDAELRHKLIMWRREASAWANGPFTYDGGQKRGTDGTYVNSWDGTRYATNAGYYTAYAYLDSNHCWDWYDQSNYGYKSISWTINKAQQYISCERTYATYNGSSHVMCGYASISGGSGYGYGNVTYNGYSYRPSMTDAGTLPITIRVSGNNNYLSASKTIYGVIEPAQDATFTQTKDPKTYNESYQPFLVSGKTHYCTNMSGPIGQTNAGKYYTTMGLTHTQNHHWYDGTTGNKTFTSTINRARKAKIYITDGGGRRPVIKTEHCVTKTQTSGGNGANAIIVLATPDSNHSWEDTGTTEQRKRHIWESRG